MFCAFPRVTAVLSRRCCSSLAKCERCETTGRGIVALGGCLVAAIASQHQLRDHQQKHVACHACDCWAVSAGFGVAVIAGAAVVSLQRKLQKPPPPLSSFEKRIAAAYNNAPAGRAVLSSAPFAHPMLINFMIDSEEEISNPSLAIAHYIRDIWAEVLSQVYGKPKQFFVGTIGVRGPQASVLSRSREDAADSVGKFSVPIPLLQKSDTAVKMGIDKLAKDLDRNNDGSIDYHEFATMMFLQADFVGAQNGYKKRTKREILKMLYAILDDDGDSRVVRSEFESFMVMASKLGLCAEHDPRQYAQLWSKYDRDGNGVLSYAEFLIFARDLLDLSQFPGAFPSS